MPPELQTIVDEHYANLYRFALSLTRSRDDAWDLTQEAFLRIARKRATIRSTHAVKSWLYTTLYREFLRVAKRASRHDTLDGDEGPELADANPPGQVSRAEAGDVLDALMRLKDGYRQVVALYYLESYSYKEIADILGIPIGTVMSRLSRGKDILKEQLDCARDRSAGNILPFARNAKKAGNE